MSEHLKLKIRKLFYFTWILFLPSCVNLGGVASHTDECRKVAYDKNNENLKHATQNIYNECQRRKATLREKESERATELLWLETFSDLIFPEKESD